MGQLHREDAPHHKIKSKLNKKSPLLSAWDVNAWDEIKPYSGLCKSEGTARNNIYECYVVVYKNQDPTIEE